MQTALAFHNAIDQCFDRCAVVDVQVGTPAAGVRGQRLADALGAFIGGRSTNNLVAARGQLQGNGCAP